VTKRNFEMSNKEEIPHIKQSRPHDTKTVPIWQKRLQSCQKVQLYKVAKSSRKKRC